MSKYFEVKMQFYTNVEGKTKKTNAKFLIDAVTFGDSETKAFNELGDNERDPVCLSITRSRIDEVVKIGDGESWFRVAYTSTITDDNGKEKDAKFILLIDADNVSDAADRATQHLESNVDSFRITKIEDGKFDDVLEYDNETKGLKPIKETTIDCPMEGDIEHLSTWNDPTSGQAVAFNVHSNLVDYLRSIGREEMTISELDQIDRNASKMLKGDFSFFMWSEFEFEREEGDAIWDFYNNKIQ